MLGCAHIESGEGEYFLFGNAKYEECQTINEVKDCKTITTSSNWAEVFGGAAAAFIALVVW